MLLELSKEELMMLHMCVDYRNVDLKDCPEIIISSFGPVYYAEQVVKMESLLNKLSEVLHVEFVCSL